MFRLILKYVLLSSFFFLPLTSVIAQTIPDCTFEEYQRDTHPTWGDSDGWGWENSKSCKYTIPFTGPSSTTTTTTTTTSSDAIPACTQAGSDSDGDGWGWENSKSCVVTASTPTSTPTSTTTTPTSSTGSGLVCTDTPPFNDDWGWDNINKKSCQFSDPAYQSSSSGPSTAITTFDDVTHVVLMAGQSNAVNSYVSNVQATGTKPNRTPIGDDAIDSDVIVWLPGKGWQVANLCTQSWSTESSWYPWRGGDCANKTVFHIGKRLSSERSGKIAIISTGLHGQSITQWASDTSRGMNEITAALDSALANFNYKRVDLIAWAQGEADVSQSNYGSDLTALISRFRNLRVNGSKYMQNAYFIAQEISREIDKDNDKPNCVEKSGDYVSAADFNGVLQSTLRWDGDISTDWIAAESLATVDCGDVHFNASSMRELGRRFADKYLDISQR